MVADSVGSSLGDGGPRSARVNPLLGIWRIRFRRSTRSCASDTCGPGPSGRDPPPMAAECNGDSLQFTSRDFLRAPPSNLLQS